MKRPSSILEEKGLGQGGKMRWGRQGVLNGPSKELIQGRSTPSSAWGVKTRETGTLRARQGWIRFSRLRIRKERIRFLLHDKMDWAGGRDGLHDGANQARRPATPATRIRNPAAGGKAPVWAVGGNETENGKRETGNWKAGGQQCVCVCQGVKCVDPS